MATFGKYRLLAELGQGGMADVFLAVVAGPAGSGFNKLTVLKRLRKNLAEDPEFVAMLMDEARIAARLNHPNVVQTNEVGQENGEYFIAMEYLDGQPLHRLQFRLAKAPTDVVTKEVQYLILAEALAGLHHAHELVDYDGTPLEIVHRDMTPHNIFVTYEGQVKVVDFGIAKAAGRSSETKEGVVKGKVRYMAPEQLLAQGQDRRVDIFAVGIMVWEIATGRRMWAGKDDLQIVQSLVSGTLPPAPKEIDPTVPDAIDRICRKALAARAEDRYANAEEFRHDLEQYLADTGKLFESRRKLGPGLIELFKDKRAELKSVIDKQLAELPKRDFSTSSGNIQVPTLLLDPPSSPNAAIELPGGLSHTVNASQSPVAAAPPPAAKSRIAIVALAAGLLCVGALAWSFSASRTPRANAAAATAEPAREEIALDISAQPGATVHVDGQAFGNTYRTRVARDQKDHVIEIDADGFIPHRETVRFDGDVRRMISLVPKPTVPTAADSAQKDADKQGAKHAAATGPAFGVAGRGAQPGANATSTTTPTASSEPAPPPPPAPRPPSTAAAKPDTGKNKREVDKADPWGSSAQ